VRGRLRIGEVFFLLTRPLMGDPFFDPFFCEGKIRDQGLPSPDLLLRPGRFFLPGNAGAVYKDGLRVGNNGPYPDHQHPCHVFLLYEWQPVYAFCHVV
jgi:hypothetical protein